VRYFEAELQNISLIDRIPSLLGRTPVLREGVGHLAIEIL
jgi:hypothetical protein